MTDPGARARLREKLEEIRRDYAVQLPARLGELVAAVEAALRAPEDEAARDAARRLAHKLAGSAATFGFPAVSSSSSALEACLGARLDAAAAREHLAAALLAATESDLEPRGDGGTATRYAENGPPRVDDVPPAGRRALVLEDDAPLQAALAAQLRLHGFEVESFSSASEFLAAARLRRPDVVVIDIVLPEGDSAGTDALSALQEGLERPVPAVVLSVRSDLAARLGAVRGQARAYLTKPVDPLHVAETVGGLIKERRRSPGVLLVDDEAFVARLLQATFEQEGWRFLTCHDPLRLHDVAAEFRPDVLLVDLQMPGCRGSELVAALRQDPAWAGIPVLVLSAEADPLEREAALLAGADDFVAKDSSAQDLVRLARSRFERSRRIRSLIARDALTGLANRSTLLSQLEVECARARRRSETVSFALLDLDDFKGVNDRFGHSSGDAALRALSALLGRRLRREDLAGRLGGEEFGIVFPGTGPADAARVLDEILAFLRGLRISSSSGADFSVSFSAGIASLPPLASVAALVEAADQALYRAKAAGKGRTEVASR